MKKLILLAAAAIVIAFAAVQAQTTTTITNTDGSVTILTNPPPLIQVSASTNVTLTVAPIRLTAAQLDAIIQTIQGIGISANVPISSSNLDNLTLYPDGAGGFIIKLRVH